MSAMCPSCGFNLRADEVMTIGDWYIDPRGEARYKGETVITRASWCQLLVTLARSGGRSFTTYALLNRLSDSDNVNTVASVISQLRRHLRERGVPDPIETLYRRGYRWNAA